MWISPPTLSFHPFSPIHQFALSCPLRPSRIVSCPSAAHALPFQNTHSMPVNDLILHNNTLPPKPILRPRAPLSSFQLLDFLPVVFFLSKEIWIGPLPPTLPQPIPILTSIHNSLICLPPLCLSLATPQALCPSASQLLNCRTLCRQ